MKEFAVNRPVSVLMLTLLMVLFGAAAYQRLPQDLFPDVSQPELMIETGYEGAASSEVELNVTRKIEEKLGMVKGTTAMTSSSGDERSRITLTFQWGTNMDLAAMDVRAKLDEVRSDLPDEADEPIVLRGSSSSGAVMVLNVASNPNADNPVHPDELREVVNQTIKPRLERLNGVAAVEVKGGKEYEVQVRAIPDKLRAVGLSILNVRDALERENISQRGGKLREGDNQFLIRTVGSASIENLAGLIVSPPGQPVRRLGEVAKVTPHEVEKESESFARLKTPLTNQAMPSVEVSLYKKSGGNSVEICRLAREVKTEVLAALAMREETDQPPLQIVISYDESVFIKESLDMVKSNGVFGLILASIILLVFLGRFQSTFIVVLAMPVSVIATFSLFYAGNISVNIFSMAGLTLAVGMVVDNAIVVTEAIFQKMEHERRVKKAVIDAIAEIGPAIWASTLTTVAVFLPVVFVPGIAGQIFRDLSWVITYTLIFSMIVAFTLIPMLTFKVMGLKIGLFDFFNQGVQFLLWPLVQVAKKVSNLYRLVLGLVLGFVAVRVLLILVIALVFAVTIQKLPPSEFFPETKVESYELTLRPRAGQSLSAVDRSAEILEARLLGVTTLSTYSLSVSTSEVRVIASFDKSDVANDVVYPLSELAPVLDYLNTDPDLRDTFFDHRLESLNPIQNLLGTSQGDILLKVSGPDLNVIQSILRGSEEKSGLLTGLYEKRSSLGISSIGKIPRGTPERILKVKRDAAADRGLTLSDIADQVEASVAGKKATDIEISSTTYDIMLSSASKVSSQADLLSIDIITPSTGQIWKLGDVATLETRSGPQQIYREERERVVTIPIFIDQEKMALEEVVAALEAAGGPVENAMAQHREAGYRVTLAGASEAMNESLGYLVYAFLVAILLVYMIMASQFESLIHPFTIMLSVPLSLIGAIIGLNLSGELISLTAMIGIIMLAGLVVNNAIILIDYINILRARGQPRNEAIINAGLTRLRPILMTTLTTVLGMVPLALGYGTGAELYKPLAIVVVCGLSFSTVLTLVFIPAIYCFLDDLTDLVGFVSFRATSWFTKGSS